MSDNLIIPQPYNLKKSQEYVNALREIGCRKFEKNERGGLLIDGMPKNSLTMAIIKTKLRNADIKFRYAWLNDVIMILAYNQADIQTMAGVPVWMRPTIKIPQTKIPRGFSSGDQGGMVNRTIERQTHNDF